MNDESFINLELNETEPEITDSFESGGVTVAVMHGEIWFVAWGIAVNDPLSWLEQGRRNDEMSGVIRFSSEYEARSYYCSVLGAAQQIGLAD